MFRWLKKLDWLTLILCLGVSAVVYAQSLNLTIFRDHDGQCHYNSDHRGRNRVYRCRGRGLRVYCERYAARDLADGHRTVVCNDNDYYCSVPNKPDERVDNPSCDGD